LVVLVGTVVLPVAAAHACSCVLLKPERQLASSDAVFTGMVTNRELGGNRTGGTAVYTVEVDTVYKGTVVQRQEVVTPASSASCGVSLPVGDRVVIFASEESVLPNDSAEAGQLSISQCSGSGTAMHVTSELGTGQPPSGETTPAGAATPSEPSTVSQANWFVPVALVLLLVVIGYFTVTHGSHHGPEQPPSSD
jgi:hypothetical protein